MEQQSISWMRRARLVAASPIAMRRINGWLTIFWIAMVPVSYAMGWLDSVTYVSALSLWALVSGHWAAWQAARVEVRQEVDANVADAVDGIDELARRLHALQYALDVPPPDDASGRRDEPRRSTGD